MKIRMELLSDAIPGSGEGTAGSVDTDISHDGFGLPIIPAKRIKGILRESSRDLEDANVFEQGRTDEIFGRKGDNAGTAFRISDGYVKHHSQVRNFLQFCSADKQLHHIFNREAVLNFYTYTRSQTSVDENGVAEHDMLRTFRVLKKGLVFYLDVECPSELQADIEKICKVTRKFGISRTRGTGELHLTPDKSEPHQGAVEAVFHEDLRDEDWCRLNLSIRNIGQMIVTFQVGKDQISENYIPGTFILGAMANAFIHDQGLTFPSAHTDADFRNIFLNENLVFSNAYPASPSDEPFFPCPVSIVREKDRENYFDMADELFDLDKIMREKIQTKGNIGEFVRIHKGEVLTQPVLTEVAYHHQRHEDRSKGHASENGGEFFQFTVMKPDQRFIAQITGKYRYVKSLNEIISNRKFFYLGKSKTAQYGKCLFEGEIEAITDSYDKEWEQDEPLVFTLESDTILRNENGLTAPDPEILKNEVAEALNADKAQIVIEKSFLRFRQIGGYSGAWNMPRIQTPALATGSVIVCRNNGGDLPTLLSLENQSVGIRTDEGFGKIRVNWHGQDEIRFADDEELATPFIPDTFEDSKALIRYILHRRLEDALKHEAVQQAEDLGNPPVNNSFVARMILFVKDARDFDKFQTNISQLRERAKKQLDKIARSLFLMEIRKEKQTTFETDREQFAKTIAGLRDSAKTNQLRSTILPSAGISEDFYKNDIFGLYQTYAIHFLTLLRLHNRRAKKSAKG